MIKGLTALPQICISKIYLDSGGKVGYNQSSPDDLYLDNEQNNAISKEEIVYMRFKMALKSVWENPPNPECDIVAGNKIKDILNNAKIRFKYFTDASAFKEFEKKKTADKKMEILDFDASMALIEGDLSPQIPKLDNLYSYVNYEENTPQVTIPIEWTFLANNQQTSDFLAFSFAIFLNSSGPAASILLNKKITSEVVFADGNIATKTGYLAIDDTFSYNGQELNLLKSEVFTEGASATPGMPIPDQATGPTDPMAKVHANYGQPDDIWIGPYHSHPYQYKLPNGTLKTTYRLMAGATHTKEPHPYLYYFIKENNKIIDRRIFSHLEQLFLYNNNKKFIEQMAAMDKVSYLGSRKNDTIDELTGQPAIVSEPWYSIVPTSPKRLQTMDSPGIQPRISVHAVFAIDKVKLLKNNSKMSSLLDIIYRFTEAPIQGGTEFVNRMRTHRFTITRINKRTGESSVVFFTDQDIFATNPNIDVKIDTPSGETNFRKVTPVISDQPSVAFFEFRDGELTDYLQEYDHSDFTYKITIEFKDPIIEWLGGQLQTLRACINQLDELLSRMSTKVFDKNSKRFVDVYNRETDTLNKFFIEAALNPDQNTVMPRFTYGFSTDEIPIAIQNAFALDGDGVETLIDAVSLESLYLLFFIYASSQDNDLIPWGKYASGLSVIGLLYNMKQYLKNSLRLSETTPTDVENVHVFLSIVEARATNLLQLYTTEKITKKDVGFTNRDYLEASSPKTAALYTIIYNHTFNKSLDLSETKDKIDWITDIESFNPGHIDVISAQDYMDRVQMYGQSYTAPEAGAFDKDINYSYSKLPWFVAMLDLFNNNRNTWGQLSGLDMPTNQKYYQTIRKKLLTNTTDKKTAIVLPETLAYFGIRFDIDQPIPQFEIYGPTDSHPGTQKPSLTTGGPASKAVFKDNFGSNYEPIVDFDLQLGIEGFKLKGGFGSTEDVAFEWQGGSYTGYPLRLAQSINNIINSDMWINNRKMSYISDVTDKTDVMPFFNDKTAPFMVNIFRQKALNVGAEIPYGYSDALIKLIAPELTEVLFHSNGDMRFYNYPYYIAFLGLFGHVEFLDGFTSRETNPNLTPTSWYHKSMIQDPIWRPLNKTTLDNLAYDERLLCRVKLLQNGAYLDQKTIDLYKDYYTFNKYFYITNPTPVGAPAPPRNFDRRNLDYSDPTDNRLPGDAGITEDVRDFARQLDIERLEDKRAFERATNLPPGPDPSPEVNPNVGSEISIPGSGLTISVAPQQDRLLSIPTTHVTEEFLDRNKRDKR